MIIRYYKTAAMNTCLNCDKPFTGRKDKIYCTIYCKSDYHFKKTKDNEPTFYKHIEKQLKLNRKILRKFNASGKATIRENKLLNAGFNPRVITHYWKTKNGHIYLFCYEFGFWKKTENGTTKFVLVTWQPKYMALPYFDSIKD